MSRDVEDAKERKLNNLIDNNVFEEFRLKNKLQYLLIGWYLKNIEIAKTKLK